MSATAGRMNTIGFVVISVRVGWVEQVKRRKCGSRTFWWSETKRITDFFPTFQDADGISAAHQRLDSMAFAARQWFGLIEDTIHIWCLETFVASMVYIMSHLKCFSPAADRYRNVDSLLYPIQVRPSCRLSKTSQISSRRSPIRTWPMLNTMQNLTLNLASHVTMSSSPLLVRIHNLFNAIIFMYFSIVLLMFDTLLTLPSEIKYIWCKKCKLGTILYVLARYPVLASFIIELYLSFFVTSLPVCQC